MRAQFQVGERIKVQIGTGAGSEVLNIDLVDTRLDDDRLGIDNLCVWLAGLDLIAGFDLTKLRAAADLTQG